MAFPKLRYQDGALHIPELGLWLDAHEPCLGPDIVFVSHAHSDHIAAHREVILSAPTARLMQARVPGLRREHVIDFGKRTEFKAQGGTFATTLLPAGHIFGSAMVLIESGGQSLLYTGDFKLRPSFSAETCEPHPADILVMETTFGRCHYKFPPAGDIINGVVRFCREALDNDETPVLLGYSLGKSQELLCGLGDAGLPLMLHGAVFRLTKIYEQFGQCFPPYERYESGRASGKVLLCPPHVVNSGMMRGLGRSRTAILTGWAADPNCRYRYGCDAAFPLSDHADYPELLEMVKRVNPSKVYTVHGFAAEFALALRDLGWDAQALSEAEQFSLGLGPLSTVGRSKGKQRTSLSEEESRSVGKPPEQTQPDSIQPTAEFGAFCEVCEQIRADSRKLEKTRLVAGYLRQLAGPPVARVATWFSGGPFPASHNKVLQLGWAVIRDALLAVTHADANTFHHVYLKHSDLGETAFEMLQTKEREDGLSIEDVASLFEQLHTARGPRAKTPLLADAFHKSTATEAKYLVKIITGDLRIGLKEGLVEDSIAIAFNEEAKDVRNASLLLGDIGETARLASEHRLSDARLTPFRPVKLMLASPEPSTGEIWGRVQEWSRAQRRTEKPQAEEPHYAGPAAHPTVWIEDKYDGIRCQLHKKGARVALFSRDLKDVTATFQELADAAMQIPTDAIMDGEVVAMRGEEVLPFSDLQRRLGRKQGDLFMRDEVPIRFMVFDLLWSNGANAIDYPLRERRRLLEAMLPLPPLMGFARVTPARSSEEIEAAFTSARSRGNEGLMIKDPDSRYTPGRRGLAWLKLKKALATLDCVVVGAEYGHGKRSKVLSDYTYAVRDENTGELKTIGKAYSGLTDEEIARLTAHFLRTARRQHGRYFEVPPDTVLEIAFDRIQPSARHSSGLALRFPRILRIRSDKTAAEIDTLQTARTLLSKRIPETHSPVN